MRRHPISTATDPCCEQLSGRSFGLRPNAYDLLEEATLNAALTTLASLQPEAEIDALMGVQTVIAGFSALRMLELSQRNLSEENIAVYGV